jgi:hypothetical protein
MNAAEVPPPPPPPPPKPADKLTNRTAWIGLITAVIGLLGGSGLFALLHNTIWPPAPSVVGAHIQKITVQQGFTLQQWDNMFGPPTRRLPPQQNRLGMLVEVQALVTGSAANRIYSAELTPVDPTSLVPLTDVPPPLPTCTEAVPGAPRYGFVLRCWISAPTVPDQRFRILATLIGYPNRFLGRLLPNGGIQIANSNMQPEAPYESGIFQTPGESPSAG